MGDLFFAKLKPFISIVKTEEHKKKTFCDYENGQQLMSQMITFLTFYADHEEKWILVEKDCGHLYAKESKGVVLLDETYFLEVSGKVVIDQCLTNQSTR